MQVRRALTAVTAALALVLAGCGNGADLPAGLRTADSHATSHAAAPSTAVTRAAVKDVPLRDGERFQSIRLPAAYTPKAPTGTGTDDYRCFVLDPGFDTDQLVSGVQISPDNAAIVHHVIVSKVEPDQVATAQGARREGPRRRLHLLRRGRDRRRGRRQPRRRRLGRCLGTRAAVSG